MECPACSYQTSDRLLRCPDCGSLFQARQIEELHHLRYLRQRMGAWVTTGMLDRASVSGALRELTHDTERIEAQLGVAASPAPRPTPPPIPTTQEISTPTPSTPPPPAPIRAEPMPPAPPRPQRAVVPPKDPFSWPKVGDALLSRRTLQTFLYIGATLLVLSAIILVVRLWGDLHWTGRQAILLGGMAALFWSGYQVRQKMGLRLSGGVLMDIGALWVPLNVGALLFEFLEVSGGATIPGFDIPLGLPMVGWMAIPATSAPLYAFLAYRFQLVLLVHGAAIAVGATLLTGLAALGTPIEWQLTAVIISSPAYLWTARFLRRHNLVELEAHLFWLTQVSVLALLAVVIGRVAGVGGDQLAVTVAVWAAALVYGGSYWLYRHLLFESLSAIGLPLALFLTLSLHLPELPLAWYNTMLVAAAASYIMAGKYLRKSPLWSLSAESEQSIAGVRVDPLYAVGLSMTIAAAVWPVASAPSATISLYALVVVYGASARLFEQRVMAYLAAVLLFAPFGLTILWLDVPPHWRAMMFAPLAVACLLVAEIEAIRHGERRLPIRRLLSVALPIRSMYAQPLWFAGYAATIVAIILGAADLLRVDNIRETLVFVGAGNPAPWTYLAVVGVYAASAYLRRTSLFVHLAAWLFLPFAMLLAEQGFYPGITFETADYGLLLGGMSVGYLALGLALDRIRGHYSKPLYLIGYGLTVVGMFMTIEVKEFNLAMVGMSTAIYAASAYLVHRGGHHAFRWLIDDSFPSGTGLGSRIAMGAFLYVASGLFPVVVLLSVSFWDPAVAWYGLALTLVGAGYLLIAGMFRGGDPVYRYHWYVAGLGMSVVGPLVTLGDPTLRIVSMAISTCRYAASAVVTRRAVWVYPVAVLMPVVMLMAMDRADAPVGYYGVALAALSVLYGVAGLVWRPDSLESLLRPQTGRAGSFTLPFSVVAVPVGLAGIGLSAFESTTAIVAALSTAALYYLLATVTLRQTLLLYAGVVLLSAAYALGLTLTDIESGYYGIALLPGVVLALAVGLALAGYPDRWSLRGWLLRIGPAAALEPRRKLTFLSPMVPFCLAAYTGTVAIPILSVAEGWPLFWGFVAISLIYGYSTWRFHTPLWVYPVLLTSHGAFFRLLFLLSPDLSIGEVGAYWIPGVFLVAGLGAWAIKVQGGIANLPIHRLSSRDLSPATRDWSLPFIGAAALGMAASTVLASFDSGTGLAAALAYALPAAVVATIAGRQSLAWVALVYISLGFAHGLRLAGVSALDAPIYIAAAGVALVVGSYLIRRPDGRRPEEAAGADSRWRIWELPVKSVSLLAIALAPVLGVAFWGAEGAIADELQPLAFTLTITGLALVGVGYMERRAWLTYLAIAVLEASYMTQLVIFDTGQPQFFVVPAALYLVAVAYLERSRLARAPVVWLETAGLSLLLGTTLLQSMGLFTDGVNHQVYGLALFFESLGVVLWGSLVQWNRPFFGGMVAFGANLVVLLFDPFGDGPVPATILWMVFGSVGIALVAGAVYLERNRERSSAAFRRLIDRLETWD